MSIEDKRDYARRAFEAKRNPTQEKSPEREARADPPPQPRLKPPQPGRAMGDAEAHRAMGLDKNQQLRAAIEEKKKKQMAAEKMRGDFNKAADRSR